MDEDLFHKLCIGGFILMLIGLFLISSTIKLGNDKLVSEAKKSCNGVVDMIYEQCEEEKNINLTTIQGRNRMLEYNNGVCIIK